MFHFKDKFDERVRGAVAESFILHEAWNGDATRATIENAFRAAGLEDFPTPDISSYVEMLERDGLLRREGKRFATTREAKERLRTAEQWFRLAGDQFGRPRRIEEGARSTPDTRTEPG